MAVEDKRTEIPQNFREFKNKKLIFVPLQFFPEATTDYWGPENIFPNAQLL